MIDKGFRFPLFGLYTESQLKRDLNRLVEHILVLDEQSKAQADKIAELESRIEELEAEA